MRHALVTGATGFLGGRLCSTLQTEGWQVTALLRPTSDASRLPADVATAELGDTPELIDVLDRIRPTVTFHLASLFLTQHSPEDVVPLVDANIRLSAQLLEAMAVTGHRRLVSTGTFWQFDAAGHPLPVNLYAATKQVASVLVDHYAEAHRIRAITLHLFDVYGPADPRRKLLPLLLETAAAGTRLEMSPGAQLIDLVHVDDVTRAYLIAAERLLTEPDGPRERHEQFAVTGRSTRSLRDLVAMVQEVTGRTVDIDWGGRPYREREVMVPWNTGERLPGWEPEIALADGLADCWAAHSSC
jgi:nucleoside-diphosphate-sugar epimerase